MHRDDNYEAPAPAETGMRSACAGAKEGQGRCDGRGSEGWAAPTPEASMQSKVSDTGPSAWELGSLLSLGHDRPATSPSSGRCGNHAAPRQASEQPQMRTCMSQRQTPS